MSVESLRLLGAGFFKEGDQYFVCSTDCDVALNDVIEMYDDEDGTTKTEWRIVSKLKTLQPYKNLRGVGVNYWLTRRK